MTKNERLTQSAVVIIAVCAVGVSVWQGRISRQHLDLAQESIRVAQEHNKLIVRPYLNFFSGWVSKDTWGLNLTNEGIGPAIVKSVELTYKGKTYSHWDALLDAMNLRSSRVNSTNLGKDSPFKMDKEVSLIQLIRDPVKPIPLGVDILIKYNSIYNEPFELSTSF